MNTTSFYINGNEHQFSIEGTPDFDYGKDEVLSAQETDISFDQPWYEKGFIESPFLDETEFSFLKKGLTECVAKIIADILNVPTDKFTLENYHHFVRNKEDHVKVVSKTRDLFSEDFNFPVLKYLSRFEKILKFKLTDFDARSNDRVHIIVRINRPNSNDFNPPHKDIYEGVDKGYIPKFVNFWIPIAGVSLKSSLPIAPESHQINENKIHRTFEGAKIEGNKYRVRMVKSWNNQSALVRSNVKYGEVLIFSSHLIHGLAVNEQQDTTRVALEFRLFKDENNPYV